jgi:hypothetical protein
MMYTVAAPFALTGPVIAGTLVGRGKNAGEEDSETHNWIGAQVWAGACLLVASMCMSIAVVMLRRERQRETLSRSPSNDEEAAGAGNSPYMIRERMGSIGLGLWERAKSLTGSSTGISTVVPSRMTSRRTSRRPSLDVHVEEDEHEEPELPDGSELSEELARRSGVSSMRKQSRERSGPAKEQSRSRSISASALDDEIQGATFP